MLRETKTLKIDGFSRPIIVKELTVEEIIGILQDESCPATLEGFKELFFTKILPLATDLTAADLGLFGPSRIKMIWEGVKEANAAFFDFADVTGLSAAVEALRVQFIGNFSAALANLSKPDIATSGGTGSPSTSTP